MKRLFMYVNNIYAYTLNYTTPANLSYFWNFGSLALLFPIIQIVTGIGLSWYYIAHIDFAFNSVEFIMREVNYGWLIRYLHSNGASFFSGVVYIHIARSLVYGSFQNPRHFVWWSGLVIFIVMILTASLGYVLPWGQMSFWAATVITSLTTAVPVIGDQLVLLIWGGFGIGQQTLTRFYSFHFILPFVLCGLVIVHLFLSHLVGSSNPVTNSNLYDLEDKVSFHPYFVYKDLVGIFAILLVYFFFVFFHPNYLGHPLNYIPANPGVTPPHIVPEWYFLPFYGILRAIPSKLLGVIAMSGSLLILAFLPFFSFNLIANYSYLAAYQTLIWFFFINFISLAWIGSCVLETPFIGYSQFFTFFYFFWFIILGFFVFLSYVSLKDFYRNYMLFWGYILISYYGFKASQRKYDEIIYNFWRFQWGSFGVGRYYRWQKRFENKYRFKISTYFYMSGAELKAIADKERWERLRQQNIKFKHG